MARSADSGRTAARVTLRAARQRMGLNQREAAEALAAIAYQVDHVHVGVNPDMVSKWERGEKGVSQDYCKWMCILYGATREELDLPSAATLHLPTLIGGDDEMDRRQLLAIPVLGVGLAAAEPWERLARALKQRAGLDEVMVDYAEAVIADFHRREEFTPASVMYPETVAHLDKLTALLEGPGPAALRRRVMSAAGETAALAGWFAYDLGDEQPARAYYRVALDAAREVDDAPLEASILGYLSYMASSSRQPRRALGLLRRALSRTPQDRAPITTSWLAGRAAEEAAALGLAQEALGLMDGAHKAYDVAPAKVGERSWVQFFDHGRLLSLEVAMHARLHQHREAERAIASLPTDDTHAKKRAIALADLATVYVQEGDLDRGLPTTAEALDRSIAGRCRWALERLGTLRTPLSSSDAPEAQDLAARIDDELRKEPSHA